MIVLTVTSIAGNIFQNKELDVKLGVKKDGIYETLKLSRIELEKIRFRKTTNMGTDIGLALSPGSRLHHGDVLMTQDRFIVVEQVPEKVISISIKKNHSHDMVELLVLIGHIIGNRHRAISIENGVISFPIQADSEVDLFKKLFHDVIDGIDLSVQEKIFRPHDEMDVHEHG